MKKLKFIIPFIILLVCIVFFYPTVSLRAKDKPVTITVDAANVPRLNISGDTNENNDPSLITPTAIPTMTPTPTPTPTMTPTPAPTSTPTPTPVLNRLTIDHQRLMPVYNKVYGNRVVRAYHRLVDSYLNYRTFIYCSNNDISEDTLEIMYKCFPIFISDTTLQGYNAKTKKLTWRYTVSKEQHKQKIKEFENHVNQFRAGLTLNDSDDIYAIELCRAISTTCTYDFAQKTNGTKDANGYLNDISGYYMIMNKTGKCGAYADTYIYLLNQSKINALNVYGVDAEVARAGQGPSHEWTLVELNNKYYYVDTTWESSKGNKLYWFGYTSAFRESEDGGNFPASHSTVNGRAVTELFDVSDNRFDAFRNEYNGITGYDIDHTNNRLVFYDMFRNQYLFNLAK